MPIATAKYERLAGKMLEIYEDAERRMLQGVSRRLARGVEANGWTERKYAEVSAARAEIEQTLAGLRRQRTPLLKDILAETYGHGNKAFLTDAEKFGDFLGVSTLSPGSLKVARILSELQNTLDTGDRMILRKANDAYADIIGRVSAQMATGTTTVRQAVQTAVNDFADRGIASFVDDAGRAWDMTTYAEMATITAISNATRAGYFDTMAAYGYDLAIVSAHAGACPLCVAWENVVLSVSGSSHEYPPVSEAEGAGLFHPRCLHHLSVYHEEIHTDARSKPREVEQPSYSYTARSRQRYYERQVRQWKRRMAVATDTTTERYAYNHVRKWQARIREHLGQTSEVLPRKYYREGGRQILQYNQRGVRRNVS